MSEKRIFYITANQLTVYWSAGERLHQDISFANESQGHFEFGEYLQAYSDISSDVLVDVIEEEFRIETMPHVFGRDRLAIQERKLRQIFHRTRYRSAEVQGREKTGRRDDQVLLTALINPEPLEQWLNILVEHKVPVAGLFSLPMLAPFFLKKLKIKSEHTLLFTPQQGSMIRETFLRCLSVKISRLLPITGQGHDGYSEFLVKEAHKNQRYLNRLRLLSPGDTMDVYVLCGDSAVDELQAACPNAGTIRYHFISVNEVMQHLGLQGNIKINQSERFFIHLLSQHRPCLNHADAGERRYYFMHEARKVLVAASFILTVGFTALAGQTILNGLELKQKSIDLRQQTHILNDKYHTVVSQLPQSDINPRDMRNAVQIVDVLAKHKTNPQLMMATISRGLSRFQNIQINEIQWGSSSQPGKLDGMGGESTGQGAQSGVSIHNRYQIASIKGRLKSFDGNYQAAFQTLNKFVKTLKNDPRFIEVTTIKYPLDINSRSTLSMTSGKSAEYRVAGFEIRAVIKVRNEKT